MKIMTPEEMSNMPGKPHVLMNVRLDWTKRGFEGGSNFAHYLKGLPPNLWGQVQLTFGGYDKDPRELWDIPEVQKFCQALLNELHALDAWGVLIDEMPFIARGEKPPVGLLRIISFAYPDLCRDAANRYLMDVGACLRMANNIKVLADQMLGRSGGKPN